MTAQPRGFLLWALVGLGALALAGCASEAPLRGEAPVTDARTPGASPAPASIRQSSPASPATTAKRPGGYYLDDGPGDNPPDLAAVPDSIPRIEPLARGANNPYNALGVNYVPMRALAPFHQEGLASWYGRRYNGQRTSSGEVYDMYAMTAAHPTLPIPSYARVTNPANGRSVIVRINDRGPFHSDRIIDLSYTAAWKLGYVGRGSAVVDVDLLTPDLILAENQRGQGNTQAARAMPIPSAPVQMTGVAAIPVTAANPATGSTVGSTAGSGVDTTAGGNGVAPATAMADSAAPSTAAPATAAPLPASLPPGPLVISTLTSPSSVSVASGVFLQLGAFSARANAESLRERLQRELAWLADTLRIDNGNGLYRLQAGPYHDRTEAEGVAERIRTALDLKPVVISR